MNAKNAVVYIVGFVLIAGLCIFALSTQSGSDFAGADDGAGDVVEEVDPDYEPWWNGIWGDYELPGETESMLFALQAAIGAVIIGFFIGRYTRKSD